MININYSNSFFSFNIEDIEKEVYIKIQKILIEKFQFYIKQNSYIKNLYNIENSYINSSEDQIIFLYKKVNNKIYIYTGLINYFLYNINLYNIEYKIIYNNSYINIDIILGPNNAITMPNEKYNLRDYQKNCLYNIFLKKRGICNVATGGGKTLLQGTLIFNINKFFEDKKTLSLFASKDGLVASLNYFKDLDIPCSVYPKISQNTLGITNVVGKQFNRARVYLEDCFLVQIDECQSLRTAVTNQRVLEGINAYFKIGWSGTPLENINDPYKSIYDLNCIARLGDVIFTANRDDLTNQNTLNDVDVIKVSTRGIEHVLRGNNDYTKVYRELIVKNKNRNNLILELVDKLIANGYKPLVIVKHINHGVALLKRLAIKYHCEFVSGNNTSRTFTRDGGIIIGDSIGFKDRLANDLDCGIGSSIFGQSFDCPQLDAVIDAAGGNTFVSRRQRLGRVIRKHDDKKIKSLYILIDDSNNHSIFEKHYRETKRFFKNDQVRVIEKTEQRPDFLKELENE